MDQRETSHQLYALSHTESYAPSGKKLRRLCAVSCRIVWIIGRETGVNRGDVAIPLTTGELSQPVAIRIQQDLWRHVKTCINREWMPQRTPREQRHRPVVDPFTSTSQVTSKSLLTTPSGKTLRKSRREKKLPTRRQTQKNRENTRQGRREVVQVSPPDSGPCFSYTLVRGPSRGVSTCQFGCWCP